MRATRLLVASVVLVGCRAAPPAEDPGDKRVRELEARVAWLEAQGKAAGLLEDEILDLEVRRAEMRVDYSPEHPAILDLDRKIAALEKTRALERRSRRDALCLRFEAEREALLNTYTPDHPRVRKVDAKIAFLKADAG